MKYDFDQRVDRSCSYSIKYDAGPRRGKPADVLPLWVADMDIQTPPCVIEALIAHSKHGIFGYSEPDEAYFETLHTWFSTRFDWDIQPQWLVNTPGVVTAIHTALRALTEPGDAVMIQQPVYYPFAAAVETTGRKLVVNPLHYQDGSYTMDLEDFEQQIISQKVKAFILCNPHNPVGRVWTREELTALGDICLAQGVLVISDEIHQDFVYAPHRHLVFANLKPAYRDITITCTAPSKSFNLAGLQLSNIFIANDALRERFLAEYERSGLSQPPVMGLVACKAAYDGGADWLEQLLVYLQGNFSLLEERLAQSLSNVRLVKAQGTYLAWLDFRALGLDDAYINERMLNQAKLWLDEGIMFGQGGAGFQRLNLACPRATLLEATERMITAFSS